MASSMQAMVLAVPITMHVPTEGGPLRDVGAEDLPDRDGRDTQPFGDPSCLRPLTRPGRPQENDAHHVRAPSRRPRERLRTAARAGGGDVDARIFGGLRGRRRGRRGLGLRDRDRIRPRAARDCENHCQEGTHIDCTSQPGDRIT